MTLHKKKLKGKPKVKNGQVNEHASHGELMLA